MLSVVPIPQQMPNLMGNRLGQPAGGPRQTGRVQQDPVTEDQRLIRTIPVPHIHLLRQAQERSILREGRGIASDVDRGERSVAARGIRREKDAATGKGFFKLQDHRLDDFALLPGQCRRRLEGGNVDPRQANRSVKGEAFSPVEVQVDDLTLEVGVGV